MLNQEEKIYSVTAITRMIKYTLEESFPSVWVEGEISNYIHHSSGHRYLSLKDENASIRLTIWRSIGQYLKFEPENGMKVRAFGDISVYEKGGSYQLNVKKLMPVGVGELEIAFRQLYEKLSAEGLFDPARKKKLPAYPLKVGLVTSPTGAAVRDIIQIARRRNDTVQLILYPAQVQGEGAELSIVKGIEYFNQRDDIDVIITGRGGGSLEDLWAFNKEILVRAVADSQKPIVTAVGHEIDTTLSDMAADLRAPTPSAAAELVIWDKKELQQTVSSFLSEMDYSLNAMFASNKHQLSGLIRRPVFLQPESIVRQRQQQYDYASKACQTAGKNVLEKYKNLLSLGLSRLESLSPLAILSRGYAFIRRMPTGEMIKSVSEISPNDDIEAVLKDGSLIASVRETKLGKS